QQPQLIIVDTFDLGPKPLTIGDNEAEIADLRNVDPRVIDFVDDAKAEREPQPRRAQCAAHHVLGAACPSRRNPGSARCEIDTHQDISKPLDATPSNGSTSSWVGIKDTYILAMGVRFLSSLVSAHCSA